jgi:hypothetical protein
MAFDKHVRGKICNCLSKGMCSRKKKRKRKKNIAFLIGSVMYKIFPALTLSEKVSANVNGLFASKGLVTVGIG